jgi:C1A family cysteine protease
MPKHSYGCRPDVPDIRDLRFKELRRMTLAATPGDAPPSLLARLFPCLAGKPKPAPLPKRVDLREGTNAARWPAIYDQEWLGSCTVQAHTRGFHYLLAGEGEEVADRQLSRLMLYYLERGGVPADTGASVRDGLKAMAKWGCCPEYEWPHVLARWDEKPPPRAYELASKRTAVKYARLSTVQDMKQCLADGYPFALGIAVYESFETDVTRANPMAPMPREDERLLGWHCVLGLGFDDSMGGVLFANSWGRYWGQDGYFWLPYSWLQDGNLADDAWTCRYVPTVPGEG